MPGEAAIHHESARPRGRAEGEAGGVTVDGKALADQLDKLAIIELVRLERFWRDQGEWDKLAAAYTEDSYVRTTWFEGTGTEFAEASREMAEERGRASKHHITPTVVRINGDRALVESLGEIHNRSELDGVEVDTIQYCRFFSRVVRTQGGWRLATFEGIYHKDVMAPVHPGDEVPLEREELGRLRAPFRIWAYMLSRRGYEVSQDDIVADDRPDLLASFYAAAERWLTDGPPGPPPASTPGAGGPTANTPRARPRPG